MRVPGRNLQRKNRITGVTGQVKFWATDERGLRTDWGLGSENFLCGTEAGGDRAVDCGVMPLVVRRFTGKEQRVFERPRQLGLRVETADGNVAINPGGK